MMRSKYAVGSPDDIPEMEGPSSEDMQDIRQILNIPKNQASWIKSLKNDKMMASGPDPMAERNDISLQIFKKPLIELSDDEMELLDEYIMGMGKREGAPSIKMAKSRDRTAMDAYRQYVFSMEEQGLQPISFQEFMRQTLAEARMGV